jgi:hypothetical protein
MSPAQSPARPSSAISDPPFKIYFYNNEPSFRTVRVFLFLRIKDSTDYQADYRSKQEHNTPYAKQKRNEGFSRRFLIRGRKAAVSRHMVKQAICNYKNRNGNDKRTHRKRIPLLSHFLDLLLAYRLLLIAIPDQLAGFHRAEPIRSPSAIRLYFRFLLYSPFL